MTDLATAPPTAVDSSDLDAAAAGPSAPSAGSSARSSGQTTSPTRADDDELLPIGAPAGLRTVWQYRYLLRMLVRKELTVRYSRSSLGYAWSYVRPGVQLILYFVFIGLLLGLDRRVENFAVYIFAGHTIVQFLTETWKSGTKSIRRNRSLIRKVYLPRAMFPIASMLVSLSHMGPPLVLLMVAATYTGWEPSVPSVAAFFVGIIIVGMLGLGLGMFFGAMSVFVRDTDNIVEIIGMFMRWTAPMLYPWTIVQERFANADFPSWVLTVYLWNPVCVAVELFHQAFWLSTVEDASLSPNLWPRAAATIVFSAVVLALAYRAFRRLEPRFAEQL